jgi:hypothetical protein
MILASETRTRSFLFLISQHHQTHANADAIRAELGDISGDVSDVFFDDMAIFLIVPILDMVRSHA